nr:alpha-L-fucosidase [Jiangella alba]
MFYAVAGAVIGTALTILAGYGSSRDDLPFRKLITFFLLIPALVSAGIVPTYIVVKELGLLDTRWAVILPGAMSVFNVRSEGRPGRGGATATVAGGSASGAGMPAYLRGYDEVFRHSPREASLRWFRDARFGLFLHFGLYSLLGRGEWVMYHEQIPVREYERLKNEFRADAFDADAIAELAVQAGMRYINLTTRHHDSFSLFRTDESTFSSTESPAAETWWANWLPPARSADSVSSSITAMVPTGGIRTSSQMTSECPAPARNTRSTIPRIGMLAKRTFSTICGSSTTSCGSSCATTAASPVCGSTSFRRATTAPTFPGRRGLPVDTQAAASGTRFVQAGCHGQ